MTIKPTPLRGPDPERLLAAALRFAADGHPVFPCVPDAKRPLTTHGLLDASTDPAQIRRWWRRTPIANLAVPTGSSSFDVLDVDVRESGSGYPAFNRLIREGHLEGHSRIVVTPSGGMHAYFPGTTQPSSRLPEQHLDFKAAGGYVLAPPSVVAGHPYEVLRTAGGPYRPLDWSAVRAFLGGPQLLPAPNREMTATHGIEPLARWVAKLPEGRRNAGTFWAACRAAERGFTDLRPIIDAAVTAGLPPAEAARTVSSALRRSAPAPSVPSRQPPGRRPSGTASHSPPRFTR